MYRDMTPWVIFITLITAGVLWWALGCSTSWTFISNDSAPRLTGLGLDRATVACLNWAWMQNHRREVAGGVMWGANGELICSKLTLGTRDSIVYDIGAGWLIHFHTHTSRGRMSATDRELVRDLDPLGRPSYMRDSSGVIWVYECFPGEHDYYCEERILPQ